MRIRMHAYSDKKVFNFDRREIIGKRSDLLRSKDIRRSLSLHFDNALFC